jgi:outer membrane biosynthesis protein TonB
MAFASLRTDERVGLGVAVLLHAALVAVLVLQPGKEEAPPLPERMTVSLTSDVSLASTAPDPVAESRSAVAQTLSNEPPAPTPIEQAQPERIPAPKPVATTPPPRAAPTPAPSKAAVQPRAKASPEPPRRRPDRPAAKPATKPAGGSRIGADFLPGAGASTNTSETRVPASKIGASAKASLAQAIARQLRPNWTAPQGVDAEKLVTILAFDLNPDGSLAGRPRVVSQTGETPSNAPQKDLHAERAIRAVQLASPFDLPPEYYEAWKRVSAFRFDRNLN